MTRDYVDTDYPVLCEWWNAQKFPPPPQEFLPGTGFICNDTAAGFLYLTNSTIVWLEWVVVNPKADKAIRTASLTELINHIAKQAGFVGAKMIFTSSNFWPFIQRLQTFGFVVGDKNTTQLFRKVG